MVVYIRAADAGEFLIKYQVYWVVVFPMICRLSIATILLNFFGDGFLAAHRMYDDNGSTDIQPFQQFRNGGDFVGFLTGFYLT